MLIVLSPGIDLIERFYVFFVISTGTSSIAFFKGGGMRGDSISPTENHPTQHDRSVACCEQY